MKRKRIFLSIAVAAAILSILVLSGCCDLPRATDKTQDTPLVTNQMIETTPDYQHQNTFDSTLAQSGDVQQISSIKAREIAVDFVGYGVVHDIQAFTDEDTLFFEVDIRYDALRYVVLLNAESGNVKRLNRHNDELIAVDALPDDAAAPDELESQTTNETTNAAITQNERASQTTNETMRPAEQPAIRTADTTPTPAPQQQPAASPSTGERGNQSSNPAITLERAIEIAYADLANRGINATYRSNSGLDWERGQRVWELLYKTHGERMPLIEYYINAENGSIVKFEWDD